MDDCSLLFQTTGCNVKLPGFKETNQQSVPLVPRAKATEVRPRWTIPEIYRSLPLYPSSRYRRPVVAYSYRPRHTTQHNNSNPQDEALRAQSNTGPKIALRPECVTVSTNSCTQTDSTSIQTSSSTSAQNAVCHSSASSRGSQSGHPPPVQMQQLPQSVIFMSHVPVPHWQRSQGLVPVGGISRGKPTATDNVKSNGDPSVTYRGSSHKTTVTYNLAGPFQMPKFSKNNIQLLGEQANSPRLVFGNQSFPVLSVINVPQTANNPGSSGTAGNRPQSVNIHVPSKAAIIPAQNMSDPLASLTTIDPRQKLCNSVSSAAALHLPSKVCYSVNSVALPSVTFTTTQTTGQSRIPASVMTIGSANLCATTKAMGDSEPLTPIEAPVFYNVAQINKGSKVEDTSNHDDDRESIPETINSTEIYLSSPDSLPPEDIENWDKLDISKQNGPSPEIEIDVAEDPLRIVSSSSVALSSPSEADVVFQESEVLNARKTRTQREPSNHSISTRSSSRVAVSKSVSSKNSRCGRRMTKERSIEIPSKTRSSSRAAKGKPRRSKRLSSLAVSEDDPKQCVAKPRATKRNNKVRKTVRQKRSLSSTLQTDTSSENMDILNPGDETSSSGSLNKIQRVSSRETGGDLPGQQQNRKSDSSGVGLTKAGVEDLVIDDMVEDRVNQAVIHAENYRKHERLFPCATEQTGHSEQFLVNEDVSVNDSKNQAAEDDNICDSLSRSVDSNQQENIPQLTATPAILDAVDNTIQSIKHSTVYIENMSKLLENLSLENGEDYFVSGLLAILDTGCRLNDNMISSLRLFVSRHRNLIEDGPPRVDSCKDLNLPSLSQECPLDLRVTSGASIPSFQKRDNQLDTSANVNQIGVQGNGDSASSQAVKGCVVKVCKLSPAEILRTRSCLESQSWSPLATQGGYGRSKEIKHRSLNSVNSSSCAALIPAQNNPKPGVEGIITEKTDTFLCNETCIPVAEEPDLRSKTDSRLSGSVTVAAPSANSFSSETVTVSTTSGLASTDQTNPCSISATDKKRTTRPRSCSLLQTKRKKSSREIKKTTDKAVLNSDKKSIEFNNTAEEMSVIKAPQETKCIDMETVGGNPSRLSGVIGNEEPKNGDVLGEGGNYTDTQSEDKTKNEFPQSVQMTRNSCGRSSTVYLSPQRKANASSKGCGESASVALSQNPRPETRCRSSRTKLVDRDSPDFHTTDNVSSSEDHPDGLSFAGTRRENKVCLESFLNSRGELSGCTQLSPPCKVAKGSMEPSPCDDDLLFGEKFSNLSPDSSRSDISLGTPEHKASPKGILILHFQVGF